MTKPKTILQFAFAAMLTFGVAAASTGVAQEFVTDGLVAMWTFDDAMIDGNLALDTMGQHDAEIMGSPASEAGVIGEAFVFDGTADTYVAVPALGAWESVSIEAWAREDQFSGIQGIVSTWQWTAGKVHFKYESNAIQVHKNDGVKIQTPTLEGDWSHILYTTDTGSNELKLYVNGELVDEGISGATPENMDERRIGSEHDGRFLIGAIDEVRIYDRVLTAAEVEQNFAVTSNALSVDPAGKVAVSWGALKRQ